MALIVVLGGMAAYLSLRNPRSQASQKPNPSPPTTTTPSFNQKKYSIADPNSIWVIANKTRKLPEGFKPDDLVVPDTTLRLARTTEQMQMRIEPAKHLEDLITDAGEAGYKLAISSGFRSEALQKQFYNSYVRIDGKTKADTYSARPGYSEHQTGLAVDLGRTDQKCQLEICFGETAEGKWLASHAHRYGFIIRYPKAAAATTGYQYEPWHLRYVGTNLAAEIHRTGKTLEEFFDLPAAPDYN